MKALSTGLLLFSLVFCNAVKSQPAREKMAAEAMFTAENNYRKDSLRLALEGTEKEPGFLFIIKNYADIPHVNLAYFYAGSCYLKLGNNKNAIQYLNNFNPSSKPLRARAYKLLADAYADDGNYWKALELYESSAYLNQSDKANSAEALFYAAYLAEKMLKDKSKATELYAELQAKYPESYGAKEATRFLSEKNKTRAGAERIDEYIDLIKGRSVGIFANHTSMVGNAHLVDTLRKLGIKIKVIFGPEHGFRGTAPAGEKIGNAIDEKTGIPVVSLYGTKRKPSAEDLKDVDVLIFDIQDVGVRFYTYISSLQEFIEAAIEFNKPLLVLDRPNPNGHYVDGPVLDVKYKSFVGMQPIPIVHGMTIGEYSAMLVTEKMFPKNIADKLGPNDTIHDSRVEHDPAYSGPGYLVSSRYLGTGRPDPKYIESLGRFYLRVITCDNYTHRTKYELPVPPSPNLPNIQSIYLYPSTCLFEGTALSEGRGTDKPFQVFGHPSLPKHLYSFTPNPNAGASKSKHFGQVCYGWDLSGTTEEVLKMVDNKVQLKWLIEAYRLFPDKDQFFLLPRSGKMEESFFTKLSGNNELWQQIKAGTSEEDIRKSWEPQLTEFKKLRKRYLLYPDFE